MKAIETKDLFKRFENVEAVKGINLEIEEGELFGLLGPNGAGKTTTISMLCTIVKPTSGSASIFGHDVKKEPDIVRGLIGIVFQDPSLDDNLTGRENLDFHGRLYKVPRGEIKGRINDVLELVELSDKADVIVKKYSGGMKRRLDVVCFTTRKSCFSMSPRSGLIRKPGGTSGSTSGGSTRKNKLR
jgi:ABC-2 type transport system ATP-binding protein